MGLVGYTSQGIYKSIRTAVHSKTKKSVASAARVRDKYDYRVHKEFIDTKQVVSDFVRLSKKHSRSASGTGDGSGSGTATPTTTMSETRPSTSRSRSTNDAIGTPDSERGSPYSSFAAPSYLAPSFSSDPWSNPTRPSRMRSISNAESERASIYELYSPVSNAGSERTSVYELESPAANSENSQSSPMLAVMAQPTPMGSRSVHMIPRVPVPDRDGTPIYELGPSSPKSETAPASVPSNSEGPATHEETPWNATIPIISEPSDSKDLEAVARHSPITNL